MECHTARSHQRPQRAGCPPFTASPLSAISSAEFSVSGLAVLRSNGFGSYAPVWWLSVVLALSSALVHPPIVEALVARPVAEPA